MCMSEHVSDSVWFNVLHSTILHFEAIQDKGPSLHVDRNSEVRKSITRPNEIVTYCLTCNYFQIVAYLMYCRFKEVWTMLYCNFV